MAMENKKKLKFKPLLNWKPAPYHPSARAYPLLPRHGLRPMVLVPGVTREVLPDLFVNVGYDQFLVIRTNDNRTKMLDLCMFDVFESIVGCCSKVPRVLSQSDGFVLV